MHLSYAQIPRRKVGMVDVKQALETVQPPVRDAIEQTSAQLTRLGIRHAIAGGVAVAAHGYLRQTSTADFLVGDEAFERHGAIVAFRAGVPVTVGGIAIDYLSPEGLGKQLEATLDAPDFVDGLPVVPIDVLIYMKVLAHRRRDQNDVIELIRAGADVDRCRAYLAMHAPDLTSRFERLLEAADAED